LNYKKQLENRIRGWLPKTPTLPNYGNNTPKMQNTNALSKPMPRILDYKFYRNSGMMIGLGIALVLAGFLGCLSVSTTYNEFQKILSYSGYNPNHYFLKDLTNQLAIYLTVIVMGAVSLVWSAIILKSHKVRDLFDTKGPHAQSGGGLVGGGGALAFGSLIQFFQFILTSDQLFLGMFIVFFSVGLLIFSCGLFMLRRKN
jgi:hypothetical protein